MLMNSENRIFVRGSSAGECIQCGKCLAECQYMDLTPQQAGNVMKKVTVMPNWYPELASCIRCGKCDHRCPQDAHPSDLMRECLEYKRREEVEVPSSMAYGINGMGQEGWNKNFFKDVCRLSDQAILLNFNTKDPKKSHFPVLAHTFQG